MQRVGQRVGCPFSHLWNLKTVGKSLDDRMEGVSCHASCPTVRWVMPPWVRRERGWVQPAPPPSGVAAWRGRVSGAPYDTPCSRSLALEADLVVLEAVGRWQWMTTRVANERG